MAEKMIAIPLHDNGSYTVTFEEYRKRVKETGSEIKARQSFLRDAYNL